MKKTDQVDEKYKKGLIRFIQKGLASGVNRFGFTWYDDIDKLYGFLKNHIDKPFYLYELTSGTMQYNHSIILYF